jgi:hypothetical protein
MYFTLWDGHEPLGATSRILCFNMKCLGDSGNFGRWGLVGESGSPGLCLWKLFLVPSPFLCLCFLCALRWDALLYHGLPSSFTAICSFFQEWGLGFEYRALLSQSRHSTTWTIPQFHFALVILKMRGSHELFAQVDLKPQSSWCQPPK